MNCNLCHCSHVRMRRPFDKSAWTDSGGHCIVTQKHNERVIACCTCEEYEDRARIKSAAEGLEVVILSKKPKGQLSLHGFFSNNSSSASRSVATGASSVNAMPRSNASTYRTSDHPEYLVGRASTNALNSVVSRYGSLLRRGTH